MGKMNKAYNYFIDRCFEFKICLKEFRSASKLNKEAYQAHFKSRLLVDVHSVEKGIGLKNAEPGHSSKVVNVLIDKLFAYMNMGFDINDFSFKETFGVIKAYIDFQNSFDTNKSDKLEKIISRFGRLCDKLGADYVNMVSAEISAGSRYIQRDELMGGTKYSFEDFISSRHSIRSYDDSGIDKNLIKEAVRIANMSPSACNRQASKVYFSNKGNIVNEIDSLITGSSGFKGETPNYLIITTDRSAFAKEEQFQWYINGGIYLSYLTLAMHSLGIGCCIMQWKAFYKTEKELRNLMNIPQHEAIIAVVGCGYYSNTVKCIYAQRKSSEDVLKIVE